MSRKVREPKGVAQIIKVRCPLCGLLVDPSRFDNTHTLDFKVFEFFGSPKGKQGGGIRTLNLNLFLLPNGKVVYDNVVMSIKKALIRLTEQFKLGKYTIGANIPSVTIGAGFKTAVGVTWT